MKEQTYSLNCARQRERERERDRERERQRERDRDRQTDRQRQTEDILNESGRVCNVGLCMLERERIGNIKL